MAATPITATTRYWRPGLTKCYYCPAIAVKTGPTRVELNAGTDLSGEIAEINGFEVAGETIDAPDLGSVFIAKISGQVSAKDSSISFYASSNSVDVRSLLPRTTVGFIVWLDEGDTAGRKMDVFPVTVIAAPKMRNLKDPAQIQIQFAITSVPAENVTVPA